MTTALHLSSGAISAVQPSGFIGIDGLLSGWRYNDGSGVPLNISYAVVNNDQHTWSPSEVSDIAAAFHAWSNVADIDFTQIADPNQATITIDAEALPVSPDGSFEAGTTRTLGNMFHASPSIALSTHLADQPNWIDTGSIMFESAIHEIGHAIGLKHPDDFASGGAQHPPYYADSGFGQYDYSPYTLMSYNHVGPNDITPGLYDAEAVQYLYGSRPQTSDVMQTWAAHQIGTTALIEGSGAVDCSSATDDMHIDIGQLGFICRAADFSSFQTNHKLGQGAYTIAADSHITTAVGGIGNDVITGNALGDHLYGGLGDDVLISGGGLTTLTGGPGHDHFFAGVHDANNVVGISDFNIGDDAIVFTKPASGTFSFTVHDKGNGYTDISDSHSEALLQGHFAQDQFTVSDWMFNGQTYESVHGAVVA